MSTTTMESFGTLPEVAMPPDFVEEVDKWLTDISTKLEELEKKHRRHASQGL